MEGELRRRGTSYSVTKNTGRFLISPTNVQFRLEFDKVTYL